MEFLFNKFLSLQIFNFYKIKLDIDLNFLKIDNFLQYELLNVSQMYNSIYYQLTSDILNIFLKNFNVNDIYFYKTFNVSFFDYYVFTNLKLFNTTNVFFNNVLNFNDFIICNFSNIENFFKINLDFPLYTCSHNFIMNLLLNSSVKTVNCNSSNLSHFLISNFCDVKDFFNLPLINLDNFLKTDLNISYSIFDLVPHFNRLVDVYIFNPINFFKMCDTFSFVNEKIFCTQLFNFSNLNFKENYVIDFNILDYNYVNLNFIDVMYDLFQVSEDDYAFVVDTYHSKYFDCIDEWKYGPAPESSYDKFMRENPNYKLYYPEPYIASPSFAHEDIWFLHILHYQYWLWFMFITLVMFYFISFVCVVRWCNVRTRPRRATRGVSRSKCADCITAIVPLCWAISILILETFDSVDYNDGFGSGEIVIGIRAYQWGWEYYYPKSLDLNYNVSGSYSSLIGNSLKYSSSAYINNSSVDFWKFYQNSRKNSSINVPANFLLSPTGDSRFLNFYKFKDIGSSSKNSSFSFQKSTRPSFTQPQYLFSNFSSFSNRFIKFNSFYNSKTSSNTSVSHGFKHSYNFITNASLSHTPRTFLDQTSFTKFLNYNLNFNYINSLKYSNSTKNLNLSSFYDILQKFKINTALLPININLVNSDNFYKINNIFNSLNFYKGRRNFDFFNSLNFFNFKKNYINQNTYLSNSNLLYSLPKFEKMDGSFTLSYFDVMNYSSRILLNYTSRTPVVLNDTKNIILSNSFYLTKLSNLNSKIQTLWEREFIDYRLGFDDYYFDNLNLFNKKISENFISVNKTVNNINSAKSAGTYILNNYDTGANSKFRISNSLMHSSMYFSFPLPTFAKYDIYAFLYKWRYKAFDENLQKYLIDFDSYSNSIFNIKFFKNNFKNYKNFSLNLNLISTNALHPTLTTPIDFSKVSAESKLLNVGETYFSKKTSTISSVFNYLTTLNIDNTFSNFSSYRNVIMNFSDKVRDDVDNILGVCNINSNSINENINITNYNQIKFSENLKLKARAKSITTTSNAYRKAFKVRDDIFTTHSGIHNMANSNVKLPLYVDYEVSYKKLLAKNNISYFKANVYKNFFLNNINNLFPIWNSFNSRIFELPFLLSITSEPTRNIWFDWYSKWSSISLKPSSLERFSLMGLKYTNKFFEYESWSRKEIKDSENYLTKIAHSRKNYLPGWTTSLYLYHRSTNWYRKDFVQSFNDLNIFKLSLYYLHMAINIENFNNNFILYPTQFFNTFSKTNSTINTPRQSFWQPIIKNNKYTFIVSKLEDLLSNREYLYRKFLTHQSFSYNIPFNLICSSNNSLLQTVKDSITFNNPVVLSSEFTRDFTYNDFKFIQISLIKEFILNLNKTLIETPLNITKISNYIIFKFFGESSNPSRVSFISTLSKSQYRPVRKGITNMIKIQAAGAVAIPVDIRIHIVASSKDVIHSWAIPSAGIKIDCIPGFSSHRITMFLVSGIYWGQCMEICGRFHHWMPIVAYFLQRDLFVLWCSHFIHYDFALNSFNMTDKQIRDRARILSYNKSTWYKELLY